MSNSLASLTAQYTDSENEDDHNNSDEDSDDSVKSQVIIPIPVTKPESPLKLQKENSSTPPIQPNPRPSKKKSALRLVSYNDDTVISDDDDDNDVSPSNETLYMEISEEDTFQNYEEKDEKKNRYAEYGFSLPNEPKEKCPDKLQDKISHLYDRMKHSNMDMNKLIQERKDFRNPSIYEKLIQFCEIDELGTNYPPELYDPKSWGKESYYEELAKSQKVEMDKREKDRKENIKVDLAVAAVRKTEEEAKKRKSKWDQPGPSVNVIPVSVSTNIKPAGLIIQPALTTTVTGTKGTVISAFGSLPKKPKA